MDIPNRKMHTPAEKWTYQWGILKIYTRRNESRLRASDFSQPQSLLSLNSIRKSLNYKAFAKRNWTPTLIPIVSKLVSSYGGELGIRTLVRFQPKHDFQSCAFDHSANSPCHDHSRNRNKVYYTHDMGMCQALFSTFFRIFGTNIYYAKLYIS